MIFEANLVSCPPPMNADVSGFGVRLAFYLQTIFLSIFTVFSTSLEDTETSFIALISMSMAMSITFLSSGFQQNPTITLQDGLVICYLLTTSWLSVAISSANYSRFSGSKKMIQALYFLQSCLIFGTLFAFLAGMESFGSSSECNSEALAFLFVSFKAIHLGRVFGFIGTGIALVWFMASSWRDIKPVAMPWASEGQTADVASSDSDSQINDYRFALCNPTWDMSNVVKLCIVASMEALCIANTEQLIKQNSPIDNGDNGQWQFGQILAVVMMIQPIIGLYSYFFKYEPNPDRPSEATQPGNQSGITAEPNNSANNNELQQSDAEDPVINPDFRMPTQQVNKGDAASTSEEVTTH